MAMAIVNTLWMLCFLRDLFLTSSLNKYNGFKSKTYSDYSCFIFQ